MTGGGRPWHAVVVRGSALHVLQKVSFRIVCFLCATKSGLLRTKGDPLKPDDGKCRGGPRTPSIEHVEPPRIQELFRSAEILRL